MTTSTTHSTSDTSAGRGRRRAVVTGAARGIGLGVGTRLVDEGFDVLLVDIDESVASAARSIGARSAVVDLAANDAVSVLGDVLEGGAYWLVVNNAGVFDKTPLLDIDLERWDRVQVVNTRSMVAVMQAAVPAMIDAGGGRIVNMASMAAKLGCAGESAYAASKAAVVAVSRIAAAEFGPHGITVNSICPGYVLTDMGADTRTGEQVAAWSAMSPLGRLGDIDDIASLVAHLASDGAGYMTGQSLNVTGGMCTS